MASEKVRDKTTLKDLDPTQMVELQFKRSKNAIRYHGSYLLNRRRPSRTPASSRRYIKGDPPNLIDWHAFARSDQLLIREQRDEASIRVNVCIDLSATMFWPDQESLTLLARKTPTKFELGLRAALNLAYIHLRLGDYVELWGLDSANDSEPVHNIPTKSATDIVVLYHKLEEQGFSKEAFLEESNTRPYNRKAADLRYWISDCLGSQDIKPAFESVSDLHFVHVLTSFEANIDWAHEDFCYFDHEVERREYLGSSLKANQNYNNKLAAWRQDVAQRVENQGGSYQLITEQTPISQFHGCLQNL